jgi:hypothetical protein
MFDPLAPRDRRRAAVAEGDGHEDRHGLRDEVVVAVLGLEA